MYLSIQLIGNTPLLMHNPRMVDPEYEGNRAMKALTSKRKKTDEDLRQIERLEWYGGIYTTPNEKGEMRVTQPASKVRKCLINAAKISKLGKAVERSLVFTELNLPLIFDGPQTIDELFNDSRFHSRLSVGMNGNKRVMRVRPQFPTWALTARALFVEDAGLNLDELMGIIELAGTIEGIGDGRAIGYGRFTGTAQVAA